MKRKKGDTPSVKAESKYTPHGGEHRIGKTGKHGDPGTGYEVTEDGRYYPCPGHVDTFNAAISERNAIYEMLNHVIDHAQAQLAAARLRSDTCRSSLIQEYGLDPTKDWMYYGQPYNFLCERGGPGDPYRKADGGKGDDDER